MALFNWAEAYSVHVPELDRQHGALMDLINELHDGITTGKSKTVLESILDRLISQTQNHFQSEEHWMREAKYPGYEAHLRDHQELLAKLGRFQNDMRVGGIRMSLLLMEFMRSWLHHHILGADHEYEPWLAEYLRKKGNEPTIPIIP